MKTQVRQISALACGSLILMGVSVAMAAIPGTVVTHDWAVVGLEGPRWPLGEVLGSSGKLRALIGTPASLAQSLVLPKILGVCRVTHIRIQGHHTRVGMPKGP